MRQLREYVCLYRLLRSGGNTIRFSAQHAWHLLRQSTRHGRS